MTILRIKIFVPSQDKKDDFGFSSSSGLLFSAAGLFPCG